ncbi:MAG: 3-deoxy-7-phosphoheptulonate synthase [Betaproteobacteria bacterium]|nr:3-deoxy-7-phosphoheptulonate synthase [Betaproteobacteria bacterium]
MNDPRLDNLNVTLEQPILTPDALKELFPMSGPASETVLRARETIRAIFDRRDPRLIVVVGPCSIHDPEAALDYAERLRRLAGEVGDTLYLVMRVYFEKPRSTTGWKGLINDPYLDDSFQVEVGLKKARELLLRINGMGLPCGTEALDPITPQYLSDLVSWAAIGARTTESQTHRELASGLSMPVGIKNGTDGSLTVAMNALVAISTPHSFLGIDEQGRCAVINTRGNRFGHVVLRGGAKPNYDTVSVALCERALGERGLAQNIMIDCSHGNSNKDPSLQPLVLTDCMHQIIDGNRSIMGVMIESNLEAGNQPIPKDLSQLKYGVSVTDACIDWQTTAELLHKTANKLRGPLRERGAMGRD